MKKTGPFEFYLGKTYSFSLVRDNLGEVSMTDGAPEK